MRSFGVLSTGALLLCIGAAAPMAAQQSQEPKPQRQEPKPSKPAKTGPGGLQSREPDRGRRVEENEQQEVWRRHRAHTWQTEHRSWQQRGGYRGFRIPDDRFRGRFGRDHWFRISGTPMMMVGRYPRFQYDGYWFRPVDPWPESWADDWYRQDDVYIDYTDGGYYLFNRNHPGMAMALRVYEE